MRRRVLALSQCLFLLSANAAVPVSAQTAIDQTLLAEINRIRAIDNHSHVARVVAEGEPSDDEADATPCPEPEAPIALSLRPDNPIYIEAWRALFGYRYNDMTEPHMSELLEARRRVRQERGEGYPAWVLDQLGIETMLANRVAMGRGLTAPRFRWVSFADPLLFPLSNETSRRANPERRAFFAREEQLRHRYLRESNVNTLPPTLEGYLTRVVTATLVRQRRQGALAVKFQAAYLRSLDFAVASESDARRVYARYVRGGEPSATDYKTLQDFLFRYIAREAGRLGLAVHIHTGGGCGSYFMLSGANPLLLDSALSDPTLRRTNFVLIHGGYPFVREVQFLLEKPNVYADFSAQTFLFPPRILSQTLRDWLTTMPEKVLFGTDTFALVPAVGWEDVGWLTTTRARQALARALTGMMQDGEITRERASELARMVMRANATRLYGLQSSGS